MAEICHPTIKREEPKKMKKLLQPSYYDRDIDF